MFFVHCHVVYMYMEILHNDLHHSFSHHHVVCIVVQFS